MPQKKRLVSIITVNWNGKKWLKKCLNSIKRQSYSNIEIILVDNASMDGSLEFVKDFFPEVKVIVNKGNFGLAKATRIGVDASCGEYVLFVNNDTWVENDFVEKLVDFYQSHEYDVLSAVEKRYDKDIDFKCNTTIDPTGSPAYFIPTLRPDKLFYLTVCFFCTKVTFKKSGGVDQDFFMYYEDVDWFWRLSLMGKKFTMVEDCVIHHAGAGSSGQGVKYNTFLWRNENTLQSLLKNYSVFMLVLILPIYLMQNIFEIAFFLIIIKPKIALSYLEGWWFNIINLPRTLKKRKWVQNHRVVSDVEILKRMYIGSGKLLLLKDYLNFKK